MEIKNKIQQIILRILCGLLLILALFLGVTAAVYSVSGAAPNLFGISLYIVDTDAFNLLEKGTALIAKQVQYAEIQPGNIVIFSLENSLPALAEVQSSELSDGVYSFAAQTENGDSITLSQSQIVAKGVSYSNFWGAVIAFASSPIGLLAVAVTPCLVLIIIEFSKFLRKALPEPEIETVKKQLEVPTYAPQSGKAAAAAAYRQPVRSDSLDDSIGLYDAQIRRNPSIERTDVLEISSQPESPLFLGPKRKTAAQKPKAEDMPLSQKKLNDAIAAAKAERELVEANRQRAETVRDIQKTRNAAIAAEKERENELLRMQQEAMKAKKQPGKREDPLSVPPAKSTQPVSAQSVRTEKKELVPEFKPRFRAAAQTEEEIVKQYTPHKTAQSVPHATSSIPRLDALLNEENDGVSYNIDDILAGLERR